MFSIKKMEKYLKSRLSSKNSLQNIVLEHMVTHFIHMRAKRALIPLEIGERAKKSVLKTLILLAPD